MDRPAVAVLFGGRSSEHSISSATAGGVLRAIDRDRYRVIPIGITRDGVFVLEDDDPDKFALDADRLPEVADNGTRVVLDDPRALSSLQVAPTDALPLPPLGPDPLTRAFSPRALGAVLARRRGPIKPALLDQAVAAGVGNIYASEALFAAGVHPRRSVARIAPARWRRLAAAVRETLERAIRQGGSSISDFVDGEGRAGYFQVTFAVYDREGLPCPRCATPIRRLVQAGRSTFYCPGCQT